MKLSLEQRKSDWIKDHYGVFSRIARKLGRSRPFVHDVYWGSRSSREGEVERALAKEGAPGFSSFKSTGKESAAVSAAND